MYRYYITTPEMPAELELPTLALTESYGKNGASFKGHTFYGYREFTEALPDDTVAALGLVAGPSPVYHSIDEGSARTAHNMMSFSDYPEGQKTWEYRLNVDKASFLAASLKEKTDPLYHEKIDRLLASFSKRLAENFNVNSRIGCMCPSLMISGGSNFPVQKKRKQVAALEKNEKEYREIMGLLEKMRSVGTGGISSDDPNALEKLKERVEKLKKHQELMKAANAAIRLKNTEEGDRRLAELSFTPTLDALGTIYAAIRGEFDPAFMLAFRQYLTLAVLDPSSPVWTTQPAGGEKVVFRPPEERRPEP